MKKEYDSHGVKLLACAVIKLAVQDYTRRIWVERLKVFRMINVRLPRYNSAAAFLTGKTRSPIKDMTCFEFVCLMADIEPSVIQRGIFPVKKK